MAPVGTKASDTRSSNVVSDRQQQEPDVRLQSQIAIVDEAEQRGDAEQAGDRRKDFHPSLQVLSPVPNKPAASSQRQRQWDAR